jgi:hypothetical protein
MIILLLFLVEHDLTAQFCFLCVFSLTFGVEFILQFLLFSFLLSFQLGHFSLVPFLGPKGLLVLAHLNMLAGVIILSLS